MLRTQQTSPLYNGWCDSSENDISIAKEAIKNRDMHTLGSVMEHSTMKMHATMLSTNPSICYLKPKSLEILEFIKTLRLEGYACYYTMDAGPNVKILLSSRTKYRDFKSIAGTSSITWYMFWVSVEMLQFSNTPINLKAMNKTTPNHPYGTIIIRRKIVLTGEYAVLDGCPSIILSYK